MQPHAMLAAGKVGYLVRAVTSTELLAWRFVAVHFFCDQFSMTEPSTVASLAVGQPILDLYIMVFVVESFAL